MLPTQPSCVCLGSAATERARFPAMRSAETSGVDFVGAVIYGAHLRNSLHLNNKSGGGCVYSVSERVQLDSRGTPIVHVVHQ